MRLHARITCLCILCVMLAGAARAQDIGASLPLQIMPEPECPIADGTRSGFSPVPLDFGIADNPLRPVGDVVVGNDGWAAFSIACSSRYTRHNAPAVSIDSGRHMLPMQRRTAGPRGTYAVHGRLRGQPRTGAYGPGVPVQLPIGTAGIAVPVDIDCQVPQPDGLPNGLYTGAVTVILTD